LSSDGECGVNNTSLAHPVRRLLATSIDMLLVPAFTLLLVLVTGATEDAEDYASPSGLSLSILGTAVLAYLLLNGYGLLRHGQTLGKKLLGICITVPAKSNEGHWSAQPAAVWRLICIRALFFPLLFLIPLLAMAPVFTISWLIALLSVIDQLFIFSRSRRTLHDYAAKTVVTKLIKESKTV